LVRLLRPDEIRFVGEEQLQRSEILQLEIQRQQRLPLSIRGGMYPLIFGVRQITRVEGCGRLSSLRMVSPGDRMTFLSREADHVDSGGRDQTFLHYGVEMRNQFVDLIFTINDVQHDGSILG
jgi:hypothetical protein